MTIYTKRTYAKYICNKCNKVSELYKDGHVKTSLKIKCYWCDDGIAKRKLEIPTFNEDDETIKYNKEIAERKKELMLSSV